MSDVQLLKETPLRPGLLVALKTSIKGDNVEYTVEVLDEDAPVGEKGRRARWETTRTIQDATEHEAAVKVRSKARSLVCTVCAKSDFGLLCPEDKSEKLRAAIAEASALCDDFNNGAKLTEISFNTLIGRIQPDDVLAIKAINSEIRDLLSAMEEGIKKCDVEAARKAAAKAKQMAAMVSPGASERITEAVAISRKALTKIKEAGEQAAEDLSRDAIASLINARTAFLDMEPASELSTDQPESEGRAVDLTPDAEAAPAAPEEAPTLAGPSAEETEFDLAAFASKAPPDVVTDPDADNFDLTAFATAGATANQAVIEKGRDFDVEVAPDFSESQGLDGQSNEALQPLVDAVKKARKSRARKPKAQAAQAA